MLHIYDTTKRLFSQINLICAIAGAVILFFITAIVFIEVVSRAMLGTSRLWVIEVSEYSLLFITFLGAPYLLEKNMHVMLDILYDHLGRGLKIFAKLFNAVIGTAACLVMTIVGVRVVLDQIETGVREATVMAPQSFWITAALPLGMCLMAFQFFRQGVDALHDVRT
ncbi:TRAP-type C4-dicarboxylate transport system, small permease component [Aliiroseovarius crassostreae]|uniref:TRAP transporter small permease protein n=1 Tax=Aliiroseovarius crassostreae TaxID=154981 RepID=A0A0P7I3A1_9RHOB|nr:TRAP transporter small permease [Aliiroseovarius crassostreae]KPN63614.1 hypothetical protein AKJ29_13345 [Aliiroseovarius crassostreae]SFU89934.1 TRAP-type C4-dicarboxylate transport system, small permease component [Aliiroseovarius crassostreae]